MKDLKNNLKNPIVVNVIMLAILILAFMLLALNFYKNDSVEISYTDFVSFVEDGKILSILITDSKKISGMYLEGGIYNSFVTVVPYFDDNLMELLNAHNVKVSGKASQNGIMYYVAQFLPWIIFILIFISMSKNAGMQTKKNDCFLT